MAAILLLSITLVAFGIYYSYATGSFRMNRIVISEQLVLGKERAGQQLDLVYKSSVNASPVSLYIYNYGPTLYNLTELLVQTAVGTHR